MNTQKMICEAFGYKEALPVDSDLLKLGKKAVEDIALTRENTEEACALCGQVHPVGYSAKSGASFLLGALIPSTYNECYALRPNNFVCEYCAWSFTAYGTPSKMKNGRKMVNALVIEGKHVYKSFNSDANNELYDIVKNPPEPPFVVLINSRGTVIENLVFSALPSLGRKTIVVNYGISNLMVNIDRVFACLAAADEIAEISKATKDKKLHVKPESDNLFNRQNDVKFSLNRKIREERETYDAIQNFVKDFDRDTRLVAKMIQRAYLADSDMVKKREENKSVLNVANTKPVQGSIFDIL